jgi:hypothetical protein
MQYSIDLVLRMQAFLNFSLFAVCLRSVVWSFSVGVRAMSWSWPSLSRVALDFRASISFKSCFADGAYSVHDGVHMPVLRTCYGSGFVRRRDGQTRE